MPDGQQPPLVHKTHFVPFCVPPSGVLPTRLQLHVSLAFYARQPPYTSVVVGKKNHTQKNPAHTHTHTHRHTHTHTHTLYVSNSSFIFFNAQSSPLHVGSSSSVFYDQLTPLHVRHRPFLRIVTREVTSGHEIEREIRQSIDLVSFLMN